MSKEDEKIVRKVLDTTYVEFIDQIAYLLRYSKNGPIHIIHDTMNKSSIPDINKKMVSELTDDEKLMLMIEWVYEAIGEDRYRETPFSIISNLTDAELVHEVNRRANSSFSSVVIKAEATLA